VTALRPVNDEVSPVTRAVAVVITPFLLAGFGLLYLFPQGTAALFAWPVKPQVMAMLLGSAYLGGAYFFTRSAVATEWHRIRAGFLPVALFATLMAIATVLHWSRFNHANPTFVPWVAIYFISPFAVFGAWLWNSSAGPASRVPTAWRLKSLMRVPMAAGGALILAVAAAMFLAPAAAASVWPWTLTALNARVMASLFVVGGSALLMMALDGRWSAARIPAATQLVWLLALGLAIVLSWPEFDLANPLIWVFIAGVVVLIAVASAILFSPRLACEAR
jgi:hypothetical protein